MQIVFIIIKGWGSNNYVGLFTKTSIESLENNMAGVPYIIAPTPAVSL